MAVLAVKEREKACELGGKCRVAACGKAHLCLVRKCKPRNPNCTVKGAPHIVDSRVATWVEPDGGVGEKKRCNEEVPALADWSGIDSAVVEDLKLVETAEDGTGKPEVIMEDLISFSDNILAPSSETPNSVKLAEGEEKRKDAKSSKRSKRNRPSISKH